MSAVRTMQTAPGAQIDAGAVADALSAGFTAETVGTEVVTRTGLDTFDRRLQAAGLTLEHHAVGSRGRLVLRRDGEVAAVTPAAGLQWPAMPGSLPEGPVRDAVAPVAGIRALMAASVQDLRLVRLELRNEDQKIVARLELAEPRTGSDGPAQVAVLGLRGYDNEARRAARLLAPLGLQPADVDDSEPTTAVPPSLTRSDPAALLLATVLGEFLTAMRVNLPGLIDDVDTEFLHDFRVAVRRTRATLKLGRDALPETMRTTWEPEFKWLGDLTTPVRDLDVYLLDLPTMAGWLVSTDAGDLEPLSALLRRRRTAERRTLLRGLRSARFRRLDRAWQEELERLKAGSGSDVGQHLTAGQLAGKSIGRAYKRVVRGGSAISEQSPAEDLHSLRKRCKELRYALEVYAPVTDKTARKRAVADLKALQDVLGRFQDSEVQRTALRHYADDLMTEGRPAGTVLAMGELIGHLDAEQDRARHEFGQVFARFVRPSGRRRMEQLAGVR